MLLSWNFVLHGFAKAKSEILKFLSERSDFSKADVLQSLVFFSDNFQL